MTKITNYARGPRGISLKDGTMVWLDPGQSEDIKKEDIAGPLPDLGSAPKTAGNDSSELDGLKAQVADLAKQVEALTADKAALEKEKADLTQSNGDLAKQVEALTKAAAKK